MMRNALLLLIASLLWTTAKARVVDLDSMSYAPSSIEGIWQLTDSRAIIEICPDSTAPGNYNILLLASGDFTSPCGTIIGVMAPTAKAFCYDTYLRPPQSKAKGLKGLKGKKTFVTEFSADGRRLTLKPYVQRINVNLLRLFPYFFRISIKREDTRPTDIDGALRLAPGPQNTPIIL